MIRCTGLAKNVIQSVLHTVYQIWGHYLMSPFELKNAWLTTINIATSIWMYVQAHNQKW